MGMLPKVLIITINNSGMLLICHILPKMGKWEDILRFMGIVLGGEISGITMYIYNSKKNIDISSSS